MWNLYLLYHKLSNRTYLGVTTDVARRLRQHRGEICGGARFTERIRRAYPDCEWELVGVLGGFVSRSVVTRWERLLKLKVRGLKSRIRAFEDLAEGRHPQEFTEAMVAKYEIPTLDFTYCRSGVFQFTLHNNVDF